MSLVFRADLHRPASWRDVFTRLTTDPLGALGLEQERLPILRDVSFEIRAGERVGLLGVNGTGKTSLCRCIAGMYHPTAGGVRVRGRLRAIFDTSVGIMPELTGRENAALLAEFMYPDERHHHREMLDEALAFSELGTFLDVPYRLYSNGMQARLCLSLISCRPCDLLILDEVFEGADSFFREKISARVLKMIEGSGSVIFVSHSPDQMLRVCNRLIVLHQAKIAFDGPVAEGLRAYGELGGAIPPG